jgi:Uma2 family endonuclease
MTTVAPLADSKIFGLDIDELFRQLMRIDGKAEIVDGRIVVMSPTGAWPALVSLRIATSLLSYEEVTGNGLALGDNATFRVNLPHRDSFSPDAAFYVGPPAQMGPFEGAPVFAVEVRSAGDYGPRAERLHAEKRDDYFAMGAQVVWDVDLLSNDVVKVYRASAPETPTIYRPGDIAEAEPAVPGWTVPVNEILPEDWQPPPKNLT